MMKLSVEQITDIPKLRNLGHTNQEISEMFNTTPKTIAYWVNRLREEGYEIKRFGRGGRPKTKLPKPENHG
jgi:transposase